MDLQKKLSYTQQHVTSIATHRDVDASVRKAALLKVQDMCEKGIQDIDAELRAEIDALDPPPKAD